MSQIGTILALLKQEKTGLEGQVSRVRGAIDALAAVSGPKKRAKKAKKKAVKKAVKRKVTKKAAAQFGRKPMTAAQKKLVSARMKAYWAKRRKAKG